MWGCWHTGSINTYTKAYYLQQLKDFDIGNFCSFSIVEFHTFLMGRIDLMGLAVYKVRFLY